MAEKEAIPIASPLKPIRYDTINKRFGWWSAVVLLESWGRKQVCFYLWQKKGNDWKRKQKFAIHSREDWEKIQESLEGMVEELT